MYVKYCENKPKSEFIVAEYSDTYFEVWLSDTGNCIYEYYIYSFFNMFISKLAVDHLNLMFSNIKILEHHGCVNGNFLAKNWLHLILIITITMNNFETKYQALRRSLEILPAVRARKWRRQ